MGDLVLSSNGTVEIYNAKQKNDFIDHYTNAKEKDNPEFIANKFVVIGVFENKFKKDVSEFCEREYIEMLRTISGNTASSVNSFNVLLSNYFNWCKQNEYVKSESHPSQYVQFSDILPNNDFSKRYFADFNSLKKMFSEIRVNLDRLGVTPGNLDFVELVFYLSWMGLRKEEISTIKKEDVKKDRIGSAAIPDKRVLELANICMKKDEIIVSRRNSPGLYSYQIADSQYLIRQKKQSNVNEDVPCQTGTLIVFLRTLKKYTELLPENSAYHKMNMTYETTLFSGMFGRVYAFSKMFGVLDTIKFLDKKKVETILNQKFADSSFVKFCRQYERWKDYFYG